MSKKVTRIGIGGPVGSGKTAIVEAITPRLLDLGIKVLIITNDVVTTEDAKHVQRTLKGILLEERILGVETGACPHTAVREDPSMNLAAVEEMEQRFPDGDVVLIESGGDNLTLTFSPALVDYFIYVIDVAAGDKIPRKNGPGITHSDILVINSILVGLALATFLAPNALLWVYVVIGAAISVVVMLGTVNVVKPWGSALTFPFVLTTWLLLLATYGFAGLAGTALPTGNVVTAFQPYQGSPLNLIDLGGGVLLSISQVFLKASVVAALLLLAGLAVNSLAAAAFALGGAILAVLTAHLFGAESELITGGLLGFSPVLTAIALGTVFYQPSWRVVVYTAVATVFTVITQAALNVALTPFAIPALTAPFVLVTWIFLLPRQCLEPTPAVAADAATPRTT